MFSEVFDMRQYRLKRPHNKSKLGCRTCKRRKVKCDEERPECKTCRVRGLECSFDPIPQSTYARSNQNVDEQIPPGLDLLSVSESSNILSAQDQALAQRYLTHVTESFLHSKALGNQVDFWRISVPAMAYRPPLVRSGMLALASLSFYFDVATPVEAKDEYMRAAMIHWGTLIQLCRQGVPTLNAGDGNSLIAGTGMLSVLSFAFFRDHRQNGGTLNDAEAWSWIRTLRGVAAVRKSLQAAGFVEDSILEKDMEISVDAFKVVVLGGQSPPVSPSNSSDSGGQCAKLDFLASTQDVRFAALRSAVESIELDRPDDAAHMMQAVDLLQRSTELLCSGQFSGFFRVVCVWACTIPRGFVCLLTHGDELARAIYAHFLMIVVLVEGCWWVDDMGKAGIREIAASVACSGDEVQRLLLWPLQML